MTHLVSLIEQNNLNTFDEIKSFLTQPPYFIEFREDRPISNLYLLFHTEQSDLTNDVVRECNGIILDKNTNQIVAYGLDRVYTYDEQNIIPDFDSFDWDTAKYNICFDGTLLKVYYYNCKWNVSTSKCINSDKSRWSSKQSFLELFNDCGIDYNLLDKNICYSYILQHPESRLVAPVHHPQCVLVASRNMNTLELTPVNYIISELPETGKYDFVKSQPYFRGSFLATHNNTTIRIDSNEFDFVKNLRGNVPDIKLRYLESLRPASDPNMRVDLFRYYQEYAVLFQEIDTELTNISKSIQDLYFNKYVLKKDLAEVHFKYQQTLRQLHGQFKKTKAVTTPQIVYDKLVSLPSTALYWILYQ